ncbi:Por secretion system C-terminal sorting domain-containing protein [Hymenobacter mucosus]|uniref:Por secretion system C-terminal sorting domain-containing protein n=2 Tax=Hymenobacter mucosus TaxID=1411120 RepID=A0A239A7B1_9BACT|nr:Por secretion system C-terminal sorting domain-containing protein [Hymenobacter mucosus]
MMLPLPRFLLLCLLAVMLHTTSTKAQLAPLATLGTTVEPGRLIFRLKWGYASVASANDVAVPTLQAALHRIGATAVVQKFPRASAPNPKRTDMVDLRLLYQVEYDKALTPAKACHLLLQTGVVEYAEPRYARQPLHQPNDPLADSTAAYRQYHLKNIRAYRAWDITKGDTSMVIGIVDGGTRLTHEDLTTQIQRNRLDPIDGVDNDKDGYVDNYHGWDFADNDNDPTREVNSVHGILVAGCAAGAADNGRGIAGVGFSCRFLPLKIYPSTPAGSFGGYEAIVYAADHGCQVINLSWGGVGGRSRFEQEVINYAAVNHDVVVVAAAGNTNAELDFYPASYDHVLSVAALEPNDLKGSSNTYSRRIDLSAPGQQVLTTLGNNDSDYYPVGGSSFSSPLVAGAAALVRVRFPQFTAEQVAAQLRQTTDNIYQLAGNEPYAGKLGSGRLNVYRAVALTDRHSARVVSSVFQPARAAWQPRDTIRLVAHVKNLLQPVAGLTVTLTSLSSYLTVQQGSFVAGALATLQRTSNIATPFRLTVASGTPLNTRAVVRYHLEDAATGYQEDQYETLLLNPGYVVLDANDLHLTLTSRGNIAYDGLGSDIGEGVSYKDSPFLLFEGGLLLASTATRVSDNVRNTRGGNNTDFRALVQASFRTQPMRASQEVYGTIQDSLPTESNGRTLGMRVRQQAYAWAGAPHRDYVILEYHLTNLSADTLKPVYAGLFMDWDLPSNAGRNAAAWDSVNRVGYVYDPVEPLLYTGVKHLVGGRASVYSLSNHAQPTAPIYLGDGFSRREKFLALSSGTHNSTAGGASGADVSQVVGAALPRLAPGDSTVVAFAVLASATLPQLQASAQAAQSQYQRVLPVRPAALRAMALPYPNPTTGSVRLALPAKATVRVLSSVGQTILTKHVTSPTLDVDLGGRAPGLYLVQVLTEAGSVTHRVVLQP